MLSQHNVENQFDTIYVAEVLNSTTVSCSLATRPVLLHVNVICRYFSSSLHMTVIFICTYVKSSLYRSWHYFSSWVLP